MEMLLIFLSLFEQIFLNVISFESTLYLTEKFDVDENESDERIAQVKDSKVMK